MNKHFVLENETRKNIQMLAEGHTGVIERLDTIDSKVSKIDDIEDTVSVLKLIAIRA